MGIPENIKALRDKHGLSQVELADIAGVSDKAVSTWENGVNEPRMGAIQKIADHFGLLKSDIIEDSGINKIKKEKPATDEGDGLNIEAKELLSIYDRLPPDKQEELLRFAKFQETEQNQ